MLNSLVVKSILDKKIESGCGSDGYMTKENPTGTGSLSMNRHPTANIGANSTAEGYKCSAAGNATHAEGNFTKAYGSYAHAEGNYTTANGAYAHAEGNYTTANGSSSHAGGKYTIAGYQSQTAIGEYNDNKEENIFEVGNGNSNARSNALELTKTGDLKIGGSYIDGSGNVLSMDSANEYTDQKIADLINGAPTTLDTLKEIADAMEESQGVVDALDKAIGTKANASDLTDHTENTNNPHSVTKKQLGLEDAVESEVAIDFSEAETPQFQQTIDDVLDSVNELKGDLGNLGVFKRYTSNFSIYRIYGSISSNSIIYFRSIYCTNSNADGLILYGIKEDESYDVLGRYAFDKKTHIVETERNYIRLQVSTNPYIDSLQGSYSFDLLVSNSIGIQYDLCDLQKKIDDTNKNIYGYYFDVIWNEGGYIDSSNGEIVSLDNTWSYSEYIDISNIIENITELKFETQQSSYLQNNAFYDSDKNYIVGFDAIGIVYPPTNAKFIRVSKLTSYYFNIYNNDTLDKKFAKIKYNGKTFSVIGDSFSAYKNWIPNEYVPWYAYNGEGDNYEQNDVNSVTDMWYHKLAKMTNMSLLATYAYSGSTVADYNNGFVTDNRKKVLGENNTLNVKPNVIFIFGGTNDSWLNVPIGEAQYSNWTNDDLKKTLNAYCYLIDYLQKYNPSCEIVGVCNNQIKEDIINGQRDICRHYGIKFVALSDIDKTNAHPNKNGMTQIANQIYSVLIN